jgi:hypothetical protein
MTGYGKNMGSVLTVKNMKYLTVLLVLLVVADGIISQYLTSYGLGQEANPFLQTIIGGNKFLLLKAAGALLVSLIFWDIFKRQPKIAFIGTTAGVVLYTGILYWNLGVLFVA